jgi:hypothetical protein
MTPRPGITNEIPMRQFLTQLLGILSIPAVLSCDGQPTQPNADGAPAASLAAAVASAGSAEDNFLTLPFDPKNFVHNVDNRFFPLTPGTRYVFKGIEDGEHETNVTIVTHDRKNIQGISAIVVFDRIFVHGELREKTFDWYAQDKDGNVWYLGEDTEELENGHVVSTEGSWETGKRGAKAGIIMLAHPHIRDKYRQEFLEGEAEDVARVVDKGLDVRVPYGSFHNCVKTVEFTALEPGIKEAKDNCPGVGFVKAHGISGETTQLVLTAITTVKR